MQPYIFPYIGYYQLINHVDKFVVYDNIQYTKKGWFNRNRILYNNEPQYFTIPIKNGSDYLNVNQRYISETWVKEKNKLLNKIKSSYQKAPYFDKTYSFIESIFSEDSYNLFDFLYSSLIKTCIYISIETEIIVSSNLKIDHSLKSQDKVLAICKYLNAKTYTNPIGGISLYEKEVFKTENIELSFLQPDLSKYKQLNCNDFISHLSIIDVLMNNSVNDVKKMLNLYSIIR